ncbi:MAG: MFS transporter, partial [Desulfovibrionaceae bacterium]|nr:MFS transporter [Desulfovibrionaceae bacterium]
MKWTRFVRAKSACAYFFLGSGLSYGTFTSRMPAMKAQTQAHEAEIGFILLSLGISALVGLIVCSPLIRRFSSRLVLRIGSFGMALTLPLAALSQSPLTFGLAAVSMGFFIGLVDVAMNTQAIQLEQRFTSPCLALMHGSYSLGGLLGALSGALFSALGFSPLINFAIVMGLYCLPRPWVMPRLQKDRIIAAEKAPVQGRKPRFALPVIVVFCGAMAACCYAAEGTVGEWGSLFLFTVKGASEQTAALVYASFAVSTLCCRMVADMARTHFS